MQRRRRLGNLLTLALLGALTGASAGCPKNEAKVCSSSTSGLGPSCSADYTLCAGGTDRIECTPAAGGVSCSCVENGAPKKTFTSDDACNVSVDTLKKRAAAGCGWDILDEP
jgi:hypothetical protein